MNTFLTIGAFVALFVALGMSILAIRDRKTNPEAAKGKGIAAGVALVVMFIFFGISVATQDSGDGEVIEPVEENVIESEVGDEVDEVEDEVTDEE